MRTRQLLPALAGALALTLPAAALAAGAPGSVRTAHADVGASLADVAAVAAADRATAAVVARLAHRDAVSDVLRLSRRRARLAGAASPPISRRRLDAWSTSRLRTHQRRLRASVSDLRRTGGAPDIAIPAALHAIAQCESGGNPAAVDSSGTYRGLFQFDRGTWASVGGSGDPAAAPAEEQYRRAALLYARSGASPWPVCGR